jgi:hypothetical protein
MGTCWKCGTELRLIGKQWLCDNCNEPVGYRCWNCGFDFTIRDPTTKRNIEECRLCGFYYCPDCHYCASDCPRDEWVKLVFNILAGQTTLDNSLIISNPKEKVRRIVQLIENLKTETKEHKVCPYSVYASYARGRRGEQGRIKQLLAKMNGFGVKSNSDAEGFKLKFQKILTMETGSTFTINDLRENGRYGQEERDACNLGICMGELKGELITNKDNQKGIVYTKIVSGGRCKYLRHDNFITKRCPHCNKDYNNSQMSYYQPNIEYCPNCVYKKGKRKNTFYQLISNETNTFTCNCPWNMFKKIEGESSDGDKEGD